VITSTQLMIRLFTDRAALGAAGPMILVAFDVVLLVASWLTFELVLEP
jgi:hypothetical protein